MMDHLKALCVREDYVEIQSLVSGITLAFRCAQPLTKDRLYVVSTCCSASRLDEPIVISNGLRASMQELAYETFLEQKVRRWKPAMQLAFVF